MSAEEILFSILSADAAVGALIGVGAACRVYPGVIPQDALMPAARVQLVVGRPEGGMEGRPIADNTRLQVDAYSTDSYDAAKALADAIEHALTDVDTMIANGCGIRLISVNGRGYEEETKRYGDGRDYSFWTSR